jgi:hypothetical protein
VVQVREVGLLVTAVLRVLSGLDAVAAFGGGARGGEHHSSPRVFLEFVKHTGSCDPTMT